MPSNGSIPARAGEPESRGWSCCRRWVYPRACGGTEYIEYVESIYTGLSPRVRGNRAGRTVPRNGSGSIPARAGEPSTSNMSKASTPVYPRACGGTVPGAQYPEMEVGLSPRVRGNRVHRICRKHLHRSIPARAGEPCRAHSTPKWKWVYPRACGGTRADDTRLSPVNGLSPRVRGNPTGNAAYQGAERSIPARAGEPQAQQRLQGTHEVYPRACGGTWSFRSFDRVAKGLSPRVRGNRARRYRSGSRGGSIPARAGEPNRRQSFRRA